MTAGRYVKVSMPYPGDVISVNHYQGRAADGHEYVKAEAQAWKDELIITLNNYQSRANTSLDDWKLPLTVTCDGKFKDLNHCPDLSNLSKVTLDAIQDVTGVNDRDMRWHDGKRELDKESVPELIITIEENSEITQDKKEEAA